MRAEGLHPYKLQIHQKLDEEDCAHRKSMCEDLIKEIDADATFLSKVISSGRRCESPQLPSMESRTPLQDHPEKS